jgi:uncharacterized protein YlxW (UPF0749 family)
MPDLDSTDPGDPGDPTEQDAPGRGRLRRSLLHPSRGQIVVGVLLAAVGFAAVTQVRSNELDNSYASYREQELIEVLSGMSDASRRAQAELARLERTRQALRSDTRRRAAALAQAEQTVDTLDILAGRVPVTGPGLRITITETSGTVDVDSVLDTVQELRTAGAEAMEINDEVRVVAQTSFSDGVGGLVVDGTLVTSPYVIEVIGDPALLRAAMVFPLGPVDQLEDDGAIVEMEEDTALKIESVHTASGAGLAQPSAE